jgi:hypothetical protein
MGQAHETAWCDAARQRVTKLLILKVPAAGRIQPMQLQSPDTMVRCLILPLLISACTFTVACASGEKNPNVTPGSANTGGVKSGVVTGDMVFSEDGIFMIVKLSDGSEVSIRKDESASAPALNRGANVEVEPVKDSAHGEWKLVRILGSGK